MAREQVDKPKVRTWDAYIQALASSTTTVPQTVRQVITQEFTNAHFDVTPGLMRYTDKSPRKDPRRNLIIGRFPVQVPLVNQVIQTYQIYVKIRDKARSFQSRDGSCAFFEQNWRLTILSDEERSAFEEDGGPSRDWLRTNYEMLACRLANALNGYIEARKMLAGAICNIVNWGQLDAPGPFATIATNLRPNYINARLKAMNALPIPIGLNARMVKGACTAYGETNFKANALMFAEYDVTVYGNRAFHAPDPVSLINAQDGQASAYMKSKGNVPGLETAYQRMKLIQQLYGKTLDDQDDTNGPFKNQRPFMTTAENLGSLIYEKGTEDSDTGVLTSLSTIDSPTNQHGEHNKHCIAVNPIDEQDTIERGDELTTRQWSNAFFWYEYITQAFPWANEYDHPITRFAIDELKILEHGENLKDVVNAIRSNNCLDLKDLATKMRYRNEGQGNTASIIKFSPFIFATDASHESWFMDQSVFHLNFERFDVTDHNFGNILSQAKTWPTFHPHIFTSTKWDMPFVVNAIPSMTEKIDAGSSSEQVRSVNILGEYATLVDHSRTFAGDPDDVEFLFAGITEDAAQEWVRNTGSVAPLCFTEAPDTVWYNELPYLNTADPTCGFDILFSWDDKYKNEWVRYLENPDNYAGKFDPVAFASEDGGTPFTTWDDAQGHSYSRRHVMNADYLRKVKHTFVHVGISLFYHPTLIPILQQATYLSGDWDAHALIPDSVAFYKAVFKQWDSQHLSGDNVWDAMCEMWNDVSKWSYDADEECNPFKLLSAAIQASDGDVMPELYASYFNHNYPMVIMNVNGRGAVDLANRMPVYSDGMQGGGENPRGPEDNNASMKVYVALVDGAGHGDGSEDRLPVQITKWQELPQKRQLSIALAHIEPFLTSFKVIRVFYDPDFNDISYNSVVKLYVHGDISWAQNSQARATMTKSDVARYYSFLSSSLQDGVKPIEVKTRERIFQEREAALAEQRLISAFKDQVASGLTLGDDGRFEYAQIEKGEDGGNKRTSSNNGGHKNQGSGRKHSRPNKRHNQHKEDYGKDNGPETSGPRSGPEETTNKGMNDLSSDKEDKFMKQATDQTDSSAR